MLEITDKRKEIEADLIDVLRDFEDEELCKIILEHAQIKKEEKEQEAKKEVFKYKSLIKKMMEKEVSYHKGLLDKFEKADDKIKKEIFDEELIFLEKQSQILDGEYLFKTIQTLPQYALKQDDVESVDYILRTVKYLEHYLTGFDDTDYDDKCHILQEIVLDLLKKDIDLGRDDLVQKHMEYALNSQYGFLAKREKDIDYSKWFSLSFTEKEYIAYCDKYRKTKKKSIESISEDIKTI